MSMAAGEYVSVSSQSDTERADIERERTELATDEYNERKELAAIYVERGLDLALANQVAEQLMAKDALAAHSREELGISETINARPIQAAITSALTFAVGAVLPLIVLIVAPATGLVPMVAATSLLSLALLGGLAAYTGGAPILIGIVRVTFWGALAMAITAGIGAWFGTAV
jgi:VIT1/CCC1 family predicted Fe2+/Mn2+ transporter